MNLSMMGRAATQGVGPTRYTLRIPVWSEENVRVDGLERLDVGGTTSTNIAGQITIIEKREQFLIFKMPDFATIDAAKAMSANLAIALIRLSAETGAALSFPSPLEEIARGDDPNLRFREELQDSEYPSHWAKRVDGTRTDGGLFAIDACILPEHERIWEYPLFFGKALRTLNFSQISKHVSDSKNFRAGVAENNSIRVASQALWAACAQSDRRIKYVLLVTTLEILAGSEEVPDWTATLPHIISDIQDFIRSKSNAVSEDMLKKLSRKIDEIRAPGMADRIRSLVLRSFGHSDENEPKAKVLKKEVSSILGKRGALIHGGKFQSLPTADENERLRVIVGAALDRRLHDFGAAVASPGALGSDPPPLSEPDKS
jgi:hypothetical protein